ncbi:MAG: hypothetical protein M0Q27_03445 [Candidatus Colwellbacteria bacterium]|nr:hypothetical protein [Candidatus Colwellbacteria bacterium]
MADASEKKGKWNGFTTAVISVFLSVSITLCSVSYLYGTHARTTQTNASDIQRLDSKKLDREVFFMYTEQVKGRLDSIDGRLSSIEKKLDRLQERKYE